jgi:hypothetical protein
MAEVRIQLPGSGVTVAYASQCERDRSLLLAEARQDIAHEGVLVPRWGQLTDYDREMAALEARNWLRAAVRCGIAEDDERAGRRRAFRAGLRTGGGDG